MFHGVKSNEIKSYEAKPYEVEYYEVKSDEIKSYEIDYIDIKPHEIVFYGVKSNEIKSYEAKTYEVDYYEVKPDEVKSYEIDYVDIKPHEIKSYEPISNEDYCIENIINEFNKFSNNLVEANTKDIRHIVDHINNGENLKETLINLEDITGTFIAYNDILPFGILSKSSYIDLRKMNIVFPATFDDEYNTLETKALKSLKMPLFLSFSKYISEEELSEEKILEYVILNKNIVQNVWIDEHKKHLKELEDAISEKRMIKKGIRMKIKELKSEKEDKIDLLEWIKNINER